jgi:uncharacterized protein YrrD
MQFKEGTDVYTAEGEHVGTIERVVIEPESREVTHIVVQKGLLFTEDKVVPISLVGPTTEERLTLRSNAGNLEQLPDFEEASYIQAEAPVTLHTNQKHRAESLYAYPPLGTSWSAGLFASSAGPEFIKTTTRNIPEGTVALKEGATVISRDGEHVGNIERIYTSIPEDKVTHFLISKGMLLKEEKLIPITWVNNVAEEIVSLSVSSQFIEALPEYEPQA